ncbi:MAG: nicotinate (nicotinamide) nucleotide adenylyltransferase [Solirubrobacteraceae bacterium]
MLGGTFNPPHEGHLALARHALGELALERVLLVPSHTPPHKPTLGGAADPEQRLQMCRLAARGEEGVRVSACEVRRGGPSYAVDTLSEVHDANGDAELTLIMGADVALTLPTWRDPAALLRLARIAIAAREGSTPDGVDALIAGIEREGGHACRLAMPAVDVSSSLVRERAQAGLPLDGLVAERVASYIATHGLYSAETRS